jgi:toxin ParE1/3/4
LSRRARGDLVAIGLYGAARWGDERWERYVSDLYALFQHLEDDQAFGRRCDRLQRSMWRLEHASHVIFSDDCPAACSSAGSSTSGSFPNCIASTNEE